MDTMNVQMDRARTVRDWMCDDNVLFIGRRGSTTIGLNDANSDIDYLIVTKANEEMAKQENVMLDMNLVTIERFTSMLSQMALETIETLYNLDYVAEGLEQAVSSFKNFAESGDEVRFLFWYQIWLMLKNQLKQFRKGVNNNKFASKIYLYGTLLAEDDILDYWQHKRDISTEVKQHYFDIRYNGASADDLAFIEKVAAERGDNTLRAEYRLRSNEIRNRLNAAGVLEAAKSLTKE